MYYLPIEVQLDILKCLNFDQLFSAKQINRYFLSLIGQYEGELSRNFFKHIEPIDIIQCEFNYKIVEIGSDLVKFPADDKLLEKWQAALNEQLPLYLFTGNMYGTEEDYVLLLVEESRNLIVKLPVYPKNIEELQIIRFWLSQLFFCGFEFVVNEHASFNPEMIKLLFDNDRNIFTKFQTGWAVLNYYNPKLENILENNLIIFECLVLVFDVECVMDQYNVLFKMLVNEGARIPFIYFEHPEHPTLLNLIMNHIENSTDCQNIVTKIKFNYFYWPRFDLSERAKNIEKKESDGFSFVKYEIVNIHNSNVRFSIQCMYTNAENTSNLIMIEQIRGQYIKQLI
ncbi:hypothetical protein ACQ4LE_008434 [Meloidogyne hapla]|uniref:F-box domain-containing protein n=1 Tax=Meloidogyne hapla TaxID=6305 RepID=A0A1I8BJK1_MELHA